MSDNGRKSAEPTDHADKCSFTDSDEAYDYWVEQVRLLNTARYRTLADHFRRDAPAPIGAWH